MNELEKAAEILVLSGYAEKTVESYVIVIVRHGPLQVYPESVDPFYTGDDAHRECHARRQADAIEDWLWFNQNRIYANSYHAIDEPVDEKVSHHKWRLDRIKWCLQELSND